MIGIIKLRGSEITLGTSANTVSNANMTRVLNTSDIVATLITHKDAGGNTIGTVTIGTNSVAFIEKALTDTLQSNAASGVVAAPIAYRA